MKTSMRIFAALLVLACVACGAKRNTQSKMEKTQQEMATEGTDTGDAGTTPNDSPESDMEMESSNAIGQEESTKRTDTTNEQANASVPAPSNEDLKEDDNSQMYTELNMTDIQIQNFENSVKDFKTRQKNMANGEMLGTVASEKDRILMEILFPEQYGAYQDLKKNN